MDLMEFVLVLLAGAFAIALYWAGCPRDNREKGY
jgi:hypothetical protein